MEEESSTAWQDIVCTDKPHKPPAFRQGEKGPTAEAVGKSERIEIRCTLDEKASWMERSALCGFASFSEYARAVFNFDTGRTWMPPRRKKPLPEMGLTTEVLFQLKRIGVNLNQISHAVNTAALADELPHSSTIAELHKTLTDHSALVASLTERVEEVSC